MRLPLPSAVTVPCREQQAYQDLKEGKIQHLVTPPIRSYGEGRL